MIRSFSLNTDLARSERICVIRNFKIKYLSSQEIDWENTEGSF